MARSKSFTRPVHGQRVNAVLADYHPDLPGIIGRLWVVRRQTEDLVRRRSAAYARIKEQAAATQYAREPYLIYGDKVLRRRVITRAPRWSIESRVAKSKYPAQWRAARVLRPFLSLELSTDTIVGLSSDERGPASKFPQVYKHMQLGDAVRHYADMREPVAALRERQATIKDQAQCLIDECGNWTGEALHFSDDTIFGLKRRQFDVDTFAELVGRDEFGQIAVEIQETMATQWAVIPLKDFEQSIGEEQPFEGD